MFRRPVSAEYCFISSEYTWNDINITKMTHLLVQTVWNQLSDFYKLFIVQNENNPKVSHILSRGIR